MPRRLATGRPPQAEEARTRLLQVRLTNAEYEAIQAMQINFAALIRSLARSYTPRNEIRKAS